MLLNMQQASSKQQKQKILNNKNLLESLTTLGSQVADTAKDEAKRLNEEFFKQLLGQQKAQENRHGELSKGNSIEMDRVLSGDEEKQKKFKEQIFFERRLIDEEKRETSKSLNELRIKLQSLMGEANRLIASTANLSNEIRSAVMQNPSEASVYQINFFEDIINLIVSFRKKIDQALVWFNQTNKRAEKKNYWNQYKKKGASFLLSGEHYSQRSAG